MRLTAPPRRPRDGPARSGPRGRGTASRRSPAASPAPTGLPGERLGSCRSGTSDRRAAAPARRRAAHGGTAGRRASTRRRRRARGAAPAWLRPARPRRSRASRRRAGGGAAAGAAGRALVDRRVDRAGADHRHADAGALLALLDLQRVQEPAERVLGRRVARERRHRHAGHDRAGRDDQPAGRAQLGQRRADDVDRAGERDREGAVEVVAVDSSRCPNARAPALETTTSSPPSASAAAATAAVAAARSARSAGNTCATAPRAGRCGRLPQRRFSPGDEGQRRSLLGEALDRREPDAAGGARDEDPLALQPDALIALLSAARAAASPGTP